MYQISIYSKWKKCAQSLEYVYKLHTHTCTYIECLLIDLVADKDGIRRVKVMREKEMCETIIIINWNLIKNKEGSSEDSINLAV